jgi:hypothetical protein
MQIGCRWGEIIRSEMKMRKLITASCCAFIACAPWTAVLAGPVPCEQMLNDVKSALASAKLNDADKVKVADLQKRGIERCKADADARADELFKQALALMGK